MFHDFFQRTVMTDKFVQTIHNIVGKFLYHFIHFIEFFNGNILANRNGEVISIMDCVFLIVFIQSDTLCYVVLVDREREPSTYKLALVVLSKISNINRHIINHKHHLISYSGSSKTLCSVTK